MTRGADRRQGGVLLPGKHPPTWDAMLSTELLVAGVNAIWILSNKYGFPQRSIEMYTSIMYKSLIASKAQAYY
jgi:hypothetical protein